MRLYCLIPVILLSFWLTSCSTVATKTQISSVNTSASWNSRVKTLSQIHQWNVNAVIAINNRSQHDSASANLQWQQFSSNHFTIVLFGPLGTGTTKLTGTPQQVILETSDGKTYQAKTLEQLLVEQTQLKLPISNLFYWVRGIPSPFSTSKKQLDPHHRLSFLQQQGWNIRFLNYTEAQQMDMPAKIFLNNSDFDIKIVIKKWDFNPQSAT